MSITILHGDCRTALRELLDRSIQTCVTSPPYYGLRKYSDDPREIGQEARPDCLAWARGEAPCEGCYVCALRTVFAEVWRVLRDDGTLWLNLGDSYASWGARMTRNEAENGRHKLDTPGYSLGKVEGFKNKDLIGIPWRVALALQADGWYLRNDNIWSKPNCMPESVTDRCTRAHEYVFMFAKSARYFYDADAIKEPAEQHSLDRYHREKARGMTNDNEHKYDFKPTVGKGIRSQQGARDYILSGRNRRTVWSIPTQPYSGAHYATMPEALIEPCVLAGSAAQACETCGAAWVRVVEKVEIDPDKTVSNPKQAHLGHGTSARVNTPEYGHAYVSTRRDTGGFCPACDCASTGSAASVVLDPFAGSGTVGRVAMRLQRDAVLVELNGDYIEQHITRRTDGVQVEFAL